MSAPVLYPIKAPNAQAFLLAHLAPLGRCGPKRHEGDPLPDRIVHRIDGADDLNAFCDQAILSVHTLVAGTSIAEAQHHADITHRRILLLESQIVDVSMADGRIANADYLEVHQNPIVSDYGADDITRCKAVYELHLAFE